MKNKKLKNDIILIGALLIVAVIVLLVSGGSKKQGSYVVVRVNGADVATYSLSENGTYELNGGTNTMVIEDGCAYLTYANCPDKLCVKEGKISRTGEVITCLPNKLTVTVYNAESGVDIVVG